MIVYQCTPSGAVRTKAKTVWYFQAFQALAYLQPLYGNGVLGNEVFSNVSFQLDNSKRQALPAPHCCNGSFRYVRANTSSYQAKMEISSFR